MTDTQSDIVDVYERIVAIIFDRLSPTFGQRTIAAIAKNVLARQAKRHKVLSYLKVADRGIDWKGFRDHLSETSPEEVSSMLEAFLDEFFEALSNLIGQLIVGKLFKEAEEMAKRGETE